MLPIKLINLARRVKVVHGRRATNLKLKSVPPWQQTEVLKACIHEKESTLPNRIVAFEKSFNKQILSFDAVWHMGRNIRCIRDDHIGLSREVDTQISELNKRITGQEASDWTYANSKKDKRTTSLR